MNGENSNNEKKESTMKLLDQARENIRRKYAELRRNESDVMTSVQKNLAPIIEPLNKISNAADVANTQNQQQQQQQQKIESGGNSLSELSFTHLIEQWTKNPHRDKVYGPKIQPDGMLSMGDANDITVNEDSIRVYGTKYPLSIGLVNLLFSKNPTTYNDSDLETYKTILEETGAHLNRNLSLKKGGVKYEEIIEPMFTNINGMGLQLKVNGKKEYLYWDDPNELVQRLMLLASAQSAGNTGVSSEIVSILEELHEAGYIAGIPPTL